MHHALSHCAQLPPSPLPPAIEDVIEASLDHLEQSFSQFEHLLQDRVLPTFRDHVNAFPGLGDMEEFMRWIESMDRAFGGSGESTHDYITCTVP